MLVAVSLPVAVRFQDMLMDYFLLFGKKSCVFEDLRLPLETFNKINRDAVLHFIHQVQDLVNSEPVDFNCPDEHLKENVRAC